MRLTILTFILLAISFGVTAESSDKRLHDFTVTSIDLNDLNLDQYKGKAVLMVNTASFCGFTPQYEGLQALYDSYKDAGLVVLGVPSNDFGSQEPGSETDVKKFCTMNYNIKFPMTEKMVVKEASDTAEIYNWLALELGEESRPQWNFHKYLISPEGKPVAFFSSSVKPMSSKIKTAIEKVLPKS